MRVALNVEIHLPFSEEIQEKIVQNDLDDIAYHKRWGGMQDGTRIHCQTGHTT